MEGPAAWATVHQGSRCAARAQEVPDQVQDLGVQDGGSLEVLTRSGRAGQVRISRADDRTDAQSSE